MYSVSLEVTGKCFSVLYDFQSTWIFPVRNQKDGSRTKGVFICAAERKMVEPLIDPTERRWEHWLQTPRPGHEAAHLSRGHQHQSVGTVAALLTQKGKGAMSDGRGRPGGWSLTAATWKIPRLVLPKKGTRMPSTLIITEPCSRGSGPHDQTREWNMYKSGEQEVIKLSSLADGILS